MDTQFAHHLCKPNDTKRIQNTKWCVFLLTKIGARNAEFRHLNIENLKINYSTKWKIPISLNVEGVSVVVDGNHVMVIKQTQNN